MMKAFEKEIRRRMRWSLLLAILAGLVMIVYTVLQFAFEGTERFNGVSVAEITGFFFGVEIVSISRIIRYKKTLASKDAMRALHIQENDERSRMITWKACRSCINIMITLAAVGGLIASFINTVVFWTLGCVLIGILVVYGGMYIYYWKKV